MLSSAAADDLFAPTSKAVRPSIVHVYNILYIPTSIQNEKNTVFCTYVGIVYIYIYVCVSMEVYICQLMPLYIYIRSTHIYYVQQILYYRYTLKVKDNNPRPNGHHHSVGNLNSIRLNETIRWRTLPIVFFSSVSPPPSSPHHHHNTASRVSSDTADAVAHIICIQFIYYIMYRYTVLTTAAFSKSYRHLHVYYYLLRDEYNIMVYPDKYQKIQYNAENVRAKTLQIIALVVL